MSTLVDYFGGKRGMFEINNDPYKITINALMETGKTERESMEIVAKIIDDFISFITTYPDYEKEVNQIFKRFDLKF